jgi:hypothetical protein
MTVMGELVLCRYCRSFYNPAANEPDSCSLHPKLAVMIGDAGPRYDHRDLYTFPCCGVTTLSDIDALGSDVAPPQSPGCTKSRHLRETGWRVFLSYARVDERRAVAVEHELRRRGHRVWRDRPDLDAGEDWAVAIDEAIAATDHFVIFLSAASVKSPQVARELDLALEQEKNVVPILIETCPLPESVRHLNCIDWRSVDVDRYPLHMMHQGFDELRAAVLFGPTGIWSAAGANRPEDEERVIAKRREQDARRTESVRQVVVVRKARDGEILAEIRLRQRFKWRDEQPFTIAGVSYRVVRAVEHSTAAIDVVVERVRSSPLVADASG